MKQPEGYRQPAPCEGEHEFAAHDHGHVPEEHRWQRCSGRYWCERCRRWFDGELCDLAAMGPQRAREPAEPPPLVAALT